MDWYLDGDDTASATALRQEIGDYLRRHADPSSDVEMAEVAASELLANVNRHAPGPAWVSLSWGGENPILEVRDVGPGLDLDTSTMPPVEETGGRGLFIASAFVRSLEAHARESGGTAMRAVLDVVRPPSQDHDPEPTAGVSLPDLDEALPTGGFDRESFLRALVVQLAQAIERNGGPAMAEASVAQVAIDVGSQMEAEFRRAEQIVERLDTDRLAECFLRLKHAIEGEFFVMELTDDRIVLGATRCPFGDVVQKAPALCRMTSAVFGGIAANNHGEASVRLEERIAVGDRQCRVVVELGPDSSAGEAATHHYRRHRISSKSQPAD